MATTPVLKPAMSTTADTDLATTTSDIKLTDDNIKVYYTVVPGAGCGTDDEADAWILYFEGRYGPLKFKFVVMYPNSHSVDDWEALAAGRRNLDCDQRNDDAGIEVCGDTFDFGVGLSAADMTVNLPCALVAEPLRAAIRAAVADGLTFAEPRAAKIEA